MQKVQLVNHAHRFRNGPSASILEEKEHPGHRVLTFRHDGGRQSQRHLHFPWIEPQAEECQWLALQRCPVDPLGCMHLQLEPRRYGLGLDQLLCRAKCGSCL